MKRIGKASVIIAVLIAVGLVIFFIRQSSQRKTVVTPASIADK